MATPYIKNDGVNYRIQAGLPSAGVATLQFTDSASSPVITVPNLTGTMALTTIATGTNALVTTDMAAAFRALDGLVMPNVLGYLTNTPPVSPANGDCYIIGAAPTGAWAGKAGYVTRYSTVASAWEFYAPKNGWMLQANSARETYRYTGGAWEVFYREGTWTPVLTASLTAPTGVTYRERAAKFTKIGNHISCQFGFRLSNAGTGGVGSVQVAGLPFTPPTYGPYVNPAFRAGVVNNLVTAANAPILSFYIMDNTPRIESRLQTNSDVAMQWTEITNTTSILGEFFYQL